MANDDHVARLESGVAAWNAWREAAPDIRPDLRGADLSYAYLREVNFREADLSEASLTEATLSWANLRGADLSGAYLRAAHLSEANLGRTNLREAYLPDAVLRRADLNGANLSEADLSGADLFWANLREASLCGADLETATLVNTDLTGADLTGCRIHGVSAWRLKLESTTKQQNLVITTDGEPEITVDNIEVAQFIYLLLHNEKIRDAIDTIGKKGVLLLGRFTEGRLAILERLRDELRKRGFLPMVFNFEKPETKDFTETVRTLAGLSRFIIADITNPKSTPLELQATIPEYMVPFVPIIEQGEEPFSMFKDLWVKHREWVFEPISYSSIEELVQGLGRGIIEPALERFDELMKKKAEELPVKRMADIIRDTAQRSQ